MKDLKQLEIELASCEQLDDNVQYFVIGGTSNAVSDDKRRDRPGSNIGNKQGGRHRRQRMAVDVVKEGASNEMV
jgi:hypothetical protein